MPATGNNAAHDLSFGINTSGRTGTTFVPVKDAEALSISIDGKVTEWNPIDAEGWVRRFMTAKSLKIGLGGKRNIGDVGNDYVFGCAFKNGQDCNSQLEITFPDGAKLTMDCIVNNTGLGGQGGDMDVLEWEALSDGKPVYTPAA